MADTKIKDAPSINPKSTYKIPVGNTEYNDARTITLAALKEWLADLNGGGGWSWLVITNKPNVVAVEDVATVNGQSILGGGNIEVEASTIQWVNVIGKPTIPTKLSELENDADFVPLETLIAEFQEKLVSGVNLATVNGYNLLTGGNIVISGGGGDVEWDNITGKPDFAPVATSGDYNDLINTPTIPTQTSELQNDSDYITAEDVANQYQEKLVSGQNIATINGQSILDGGNIEVSGGGGVFTYENTEETTTTEIGITNGDEEYPLTRDAVIGYRVLAKLTEGEGDDQETREYDITNLCYLSFSEDGHSIIANVGNNGDVSTMFPGKAFAGITYFAVFVRY